MHHALAATDGVAESDGVPASCSVPPPDGVPTNGAALPSLGDRPTIKDEIYAALRERIVFGEIGPGDRLVETDLAARFGVSKTPVREALLTLQGEGLVTLQTWHRQMIGELAQRLDASAEGQPAPVPPPTSARGSRESGATAAG